jgi:ferric-dicitrate binding protein FerR (iron transport regulator)
MVKPYFAMKEPTNEIKELAARWMDGTITPEEKARFEAWYNGLDFSQLELPDHWAGGPEEIEAHILEKLKTSLRATEPSPRATQASPPETKGGSVRAIGIRRTTRWVAAACILLTIGAGAYIWKKNSERPEKAAAQMLAGAVVPGRDGAVLTLADGSRIVLDSAGNGHIATQGGRQVLLQNGAIVYEKEKAAAGKAGGNAPAEVVVYNTMTTPRGRQFRVVLPDGSGVWLNAASTLRYPTAFTGNRREVELSGEAYFEIAKDESKPFVVSARGTQVQVLGTAFNLMAYPDEKAVNTTLVTGAVRVVSAKGSLVLHPDQQACLPDSADRPTVSEPNLKVVLAWKDGRFRFDGAKITAIMRQIARWYDVDIEYRGEIPSNEFNGSISRAEYAQKILTALERTGNVHFSVEGKKIIVMGGSR